MIAEINPIHRPDMESYALGCAIMYPDCAKIILGYDMSIFYEDRNRAVYGAIEGLVKNNVNPDIVLVKDFLSKQGKIKTIGGASYLMSLTNSVASKSNFEYYLTYLTDLKSLRDLQVIAQSVLSKTHQHADPHEILAFADKEILKSLKTYSRSAFMPIEEIGTEYLDNLLEKKQIGISSGIPKIDFVTGGFRPPELIILAARPAMGKTDFALNLALNASKNGYPAGFISLEMTDKQCFARLLAQETKIDKKAFKDRDPAYLKDNEGKLRKEIIQATDLIIKSKLQIIDAGSAKIANIKSYAERLVSQGCKLIIIDYLQLIQLERRNGSNDASAIGDITRALKMEVAKELNVPVICLSQLNRSVETRGGAKRPQLSDLRQSGEIEQDADTVMFLYRPEYYDFLTDEEGKSTQGMLEVIFAKHREGETGSIFLGYRPDLGKVYNSSEDIYSTPF